MFGYTFIENKTAQIVICGVDGAGRRSFLQTFYQYRANMQKCEIKIEEKSQRILYVVILDGLHLRNNEEEEILSAIKDENKINTAHQNHILFVVNKSDLIFDGKNNHSLLKEIREEYASINFGPNVQSSLITFSALGVRILKSFLNRKLDEDDCDDAKLLLGKIGIRLSPKISPIELKRYLLSNKQMLYSLSGETYIKNILKDWRNQHGIFAQP